MHRSVNCVLLWFVCFVIVFFIVFFGTALGTSNCWYIRLVSFSLSFLLAECLNTRFTLKYYNAIIKLCFGTSSWTTCKISLMTNTTRDDQLISGQHFRPLEGVILWSVSVTDEGLSIRIKDVTPSVALPRIIFISCFHSSALLLLLNGLVAMTKPTFWTLTFHLSSFIRFLSPKLWLTSRDLDRRVQVTASHTGC